MPAPIQEIDIGHPQPRSLERALQLLRVGEAIAFPGDTGYAVGCELCSKRGGETLARLKRRPKGLPPTLLCSSMTELARYGRVSNTAFRTLRQLTPGPFTFVLEATREVPRSLLGSGERVGLRVPDAAIPRALVEGLGSPLLSRSATLEDGERLLDGRDIKARWGDQLGLILDGGEPAEGPSTVLSLIDDELELLREGVGEVDLE